LPEPNLQRQQSVLNLLNNFQGVDPLKKLFWSELNYDRVNKSLSRRGWKENVANLLADDPVLLASGANDFQVIYGRLASDKLLMGDERPVVSKLLQEHPYALFVFSNSKQEHFHFLNVKYDDDVQKRRLFRRITVGPNERLRTASERIALLDLADISLDLFGLSPLAVQQRHDQAFDVEPVTREFFTQYHSIFTDVEESITGFGRDKERRHLFTQRLFNRLMFIAFIEKKGWLKFNGDADYLTALWRAHQNDKSVSDKNFYRDRLKALFFFGLNSSNEVNQIGINKGAFLKTLIGEVPYLNGGLFEEDEDDKNEDIKVSDKAIGAVLNGLFAKFNFTVTESTPLDVEVAVDPEMLGKIFEELVTGRHESGSYYTPKPIVSFMCREALKGYLETNASGESKEAIERFVETQEPNDLRNPETVLDALRKVKVCDPACGSGAYLLGMLHELLDLRAALFQSRKLDAKSVYDRKLDIIQSNIYGVDIDLFAVNIARLRLWLSLAVDFEGTEPQPLPNLDYKVEAGDSLLGPNPSGGLEMGFRKQLIDEFLKLKAEYLTSHHEHKKALKRNITKLKSDIVSFGKHAQTVGFDWAVEFAEVFLNDGGFDITLANPPYVRQELIAPIKPQLEKAFPQVYMGTADVYCYFYARSLELLRKGGMLSFISSNKWFRANYGTKLRGYVAATCDVRTIIDFGELPVFETAATFPMIFVARKDQNSHPATIFTQVKSLAEPYPDISALINKRGFVLPEDALKGTKWRIADAKASNLIAIMEKAGKTLEEYAGGQIFYGVKPGCNDAFIVSQEKRDELVRLDPKCKSVLKPVVHGDEVRRWRIDHEDQWIIYAPWDFDIRQYPSIEEHLSQYKKQLKTRPECAQGRYNWWCLARYAPNYVHLFDKPKIIYPDIAKESRFTFEAKPLYLTNTVYFISTDDLYLLGVLNSDAVWNYAKEHLTVLGDASKGGRLRFFRQFVQEIPIPKPSPPDRVAIEELASMCLKRRGQKCEQNESELNARVARLFGLPKPKSSEHGASITNMVRG